MSSSGFDSGSADVEMSDMNDNEPVMPSTSRDGLSTMMVVDSQGDKFDKVTKRKLDTDGKRGEGAKQSRFSPADFPQVGGNSDGTIGDQLPDEDTGMVIPTILFDDNETYETDSAVGDTLHGNVYQQEHMFFLLHRAQKKKYPFRFATEMKLAGKFDDAVLEYQDPVRGRVHRFLQFKHVKVDEMDKVNKMIKVNDLLTIAKRDPFGMVKYFKSWREIRNNPIFKTSESKEFIICTNYGLDVSKLKDIKVTKIEMDDWLKVTEIKRDDSLKVTKEPKEKPCFYKFVDEPSILRDKLKSAAGASDEEISNFFKDLSLAVNQPNEIELDTMIKYELGAADQFNLLDVDLIMDFFHNIMVKLLKEPGKDRKFLSNQDVDALFKELQRKLSCFSAIGLKSQYLKQCKEYDIKFKVENSVLRKFLDSTDSLRNSPLIVKSSNPTLLPALRVHQTVEESEKYKEMDSSIFIRLEELSLRDITDDVVLCAFESSKSYELLVIDCGSLKNDETTQKLWSRLRDILGKNRSKKLILIIHENNSSALRNIRCERDDDIIIDDSIIDLAEDSQQNLLKNKVLKFQGNDGNTSFKEIFGINECDDNRSNKLSALYKIIEKQTLNKLIRSEEIVIGSEIQGIGDVEKYYIPRTIVERVVIKAEILVDPKIPDLFVIGGIDQNALEKIVKTENRNQTLEKRSLKKLDLDKYHILPRGREADHYRNMCDQNNSNRNIHWLQGETGALVWQQSSGSITNLLAFRNTSMDHDNREGPGATGLTENELAKHDQKRRIVILSDVAGMGKSTLLTHLARKMKRDQSSLLVIKVDLTQYTGVLKVEKDERTFEKDDTNGAVNFLVDKVSNLNTDFERNIFKELVKVTGETAVLIDGYDEICPDYGDVVIDLLRSLAKLPVKRLFITTRPHTSVDLEQEFGMFSHVLQPFDQENKMEFLTKFWGAELNLNDSDGTIKVNLQKHACAVLDILSKLINSQMQEFTGIPLQLRLVAEVLPFGDEEKLKRFESSEKPIYITDLYGSFIKKKFEILFTQKLLGDSTNLGQKKNRKLMYRSFLTKHQKSALEALFDGNTISQQTTDESSSSQDEGEERSGIVNRVINGKPHFVHRTFAEYFAATFLSRKLKHNGCDPQEKKFIVEKLLIEPKYQTIRALLNCLLCREDHAPEKYPWEFDLTENFECSQTLYHVAAKECNTGIVKYFSKRFEEPATDPDINREDELHSTPLVIAVKEHALANVPMCVRLIECLVAGGANINKKSQIAGTVLHFALKIGAELEVIKYLGDEINFESDFVLPPLHMALGCRAKLKVLKYLVEKGANVNPAYEHSILSQRRLTTLDFALQSCYQLEVIKYLVDKGAKIVNESKNGLTTLHTALQHGAHLAVVKYLVANGAKPNWKSNHGLTVLHSAVKSGSRLNVIKYLVANGADIDGEFEYGSTLLHSAIQPSHGLPREPFWIACLGRRLIPEPGAVSNPLFTVRKHRAKLNLVKYLVNYGAEINHKSKEGWTALHYALESGAELNLVKYLVKKGAEIDRKTEDSLGLTPLHITLEHSDNLNVVEYLLEKGAKINCESEDGSTPLSYALRRRAKYDVIERLFKKGAKINGESKYNSTVLHDAIEGHAELNVVECLVENGAEIDRESKKFYGSTALRYAFEERAESNVVKYLVKKCADVNRESEGGWTALHSALQNGFQLDVIKCLVEHGAEINHESENGCTPLHCALGRYPADLNTVMYLVENGAEINRQSKDGSTALHYALRSGCQLDVIKCLVKNRADVNPESKNGCTPLHCALGRNHADLNTVMYLVENGAEINRKSKHDLTALEYALSWFFIRPDVKKYLVEKGAKIRGFKREADGTDYQRFISNHINDGLMGPFWTL